MQWKLCRIGHLNREAAKIQHLFIARSALIACINLVHAIPLLCQRTKF